MDEQLDSLIKRAEDLKNVPYDSPRMKLWETKAKALVRSRYGDEVEQVFESALWFGQVITSEAHAQEMHVEAMTKAVELLTSLKDEEPETPQKADERSAVGPTNRDLTTLHPEVRARCQKLYNSGDFAEAVEKAFKIVRDRLRSLSGYERGADAFGKGGLYIRGAAAPHVDNDFQNGVKYLTMAVDQFRNEKVHTADGNIEDAVRAYEYLRLSSLALHLLDAAEIRAKRS